MWPFKRKKPQDAKLTDPDFSERFGFSRSTISGATVNDATALRQSAVYACVRVIAETIASLPLKVYRRNGDTREQINHPLNRLLGITPNGEQTAFELREFQMTCLGLRGNAFAQKVYSNRGAIGEINPLNAAYMKVDRDSDGNLIFDYQETGNAQVFTEGQIWRIAGLGSNGVTGLSPVSLARESIGASIAVEGHGAALFKNGVNPSIILSHPSVLEEKQYKRLKDQIDQNNAGFANNGKPMLVEGGMAATAIGMSNLDAQFIESRKFQAEDIARWYRVPPHMIGLLDRATFSNIEQQSIDFVQNTIRPWLTRIEATMMRDLLSPSEQQNLFLSHTVDALLRGDTATRYEAYGKAIDKGWKTRNEVRKLENLPPMGGLDEFVLPVNVETISEREERFAGAMAQVLADQEINALRQERNKGGDDFGDRIVNFYARFNSRLKELGVDPQAADDYTLQRCSEVENNKFDLIERRAQTQLAGIL